MRQPVKGHNKTNRNTKTVRRKISNQLKHRQNHKEYGTSKLEQYFAHEFLDKLCLKYVYEYEAKDIKRFFDFAVTSEENYPYKYVIKEGVNSIDQDAQLFIPNFLIEVDGDYFHGNPLFVDESKLNPMQKHNKFVDKLKDEWCGMHCIPLLRIWENDIRNNPQKVINMICEYSLAAQKKKKIIENKKKPH